MTAGKILPPEEALGRAAEWQAAGLVVRLAVGAFDLLNVGQARALARAKAPGARLVIAVRDDADARAALGAGRPVLDAAERVRLAAALRAGDVVTRVDAGGLARLVARIGAALDADADRAHDPWPRVRGTGRAEGGMS